MADRASSSRQKRPRCPRQNQKSKEISYETSFRNLSSKGKATVNYVNQKPKQRPLNTIPGTTCAVFDNSCPAYKWLRSGWIVEERILRNDRLYRYYYDPLGQSYSARYAVEHIYAKIEKDTERKHPKRKVPERNVPERKVPELKVPKLNDNELKVPELIILD